MWCDADGSRAAVVIATSLRVGTPLLLATTSAMTYFHRPTQMLPRSGWTCDSNQRPRWPTTSIESESTSKRWKVQMRCFYHSKRLLSYFSTLCVCVCVCVYLIVEYHILKNEETGALVGEDSQQSKDVYDLNLTTIDQSYNVQLAAMEAKVRTHDTCMSCLAMPMPCRFPGRIFRWFGGCLLMMMMMIFSWKHWKTNWLKPN